MPMSDLAATGNSAWPAALQFNSLTTLRCKLRTLLDQIIGYGDILDSGDAAVSEASIGGIHHVSGIAKSLSAAIEAWPQKPSARHLHVFGIRLLDFAGHMSRQVAKIAAAVQPATGAAEDLAGLAAAVDGLSPVARDLISNSAAFAAPDSFTEAASRPMVVEPGGRRLLQVTSAQTADPDGRKALLLVVDDNEGNRELLSRRIERDGYSVLMASGGRQALEMVRSQEFDLVLLDVMMPEVDGLTVLCEMKEDQALRDVPVIMISAVDEASSVAKCIEAGAEDYLPKPFDPVVLRARIRASLERKRLRDAEKARTDELRTALSEIEEARRVSDSLLLDILPAPIAKELRERGAVDPMYFEDVTIGFTDFVGFTLSTERLAAEELVYLLNDYFTSFDKIIERHGLEKLKTIGDSYMFAGGLPLRTPSHPVDTVLAACELIQTVSELEVSTGVGWQVRIGIHTGPVIAGVVGIRKFAFDIWGESVNFASRMESSGAPNRINISERTYARVKDFFDCEPRGKVRIKDGREFDMYFVNNVKPQLLDNSAAIPSGFSRRYRIYFKKDPLSFPACLLPAAQQAGRL